MGGRVIRGVLTPLLTPFNDDGTIATDLWVEHAQRVLAEGSAGIVTFGTTGEALSVGIDERIAAVGALVEGGVDPSVLIAGTGLSNIEDTVRLSRGCMNLGCAGLLVLPPFYYKAVTEDGLFDYFTMLVEKLGPGASVFLYHIPPVAIVGIPPALAARLRAAYPDTIVGIKDSSGDWDNTRKLLGIEGLTVYPGSELPLLEGLRRGAPGCITATANINAGPIAEVVQRFGSGDEAAATALHEAVRRLREIMQEYAPIPAQKRLMAMRTGDARWANVRPPLTAMDEAAGKELAAKLQAGPGLSFDL